MTERSMLNVELEKIAHSMGFDTERDMFYHFYATEQLSIAEIALRVNISVPTVRKRILAAGIEIRSRGGPNNWSGKSQMLHRLDQRVFFWFPIQTIAALLGLSQMWVWKYRTELLGGNKNAVLRDIADQGVEEIREPVFDPSFITTASEQRLHRLLSLTEGDGGQVDPGQRSVRGADGLGEPSKDDPGL